MKRIIAILLLAVQPHLYSQEEKYAAPRSAFSLQYAGSTGFLSLGYFRLWKKEKLQLGLQYGYTPEAFGGTLHSASLKFLYDPFKIGLGKRLRLEPLQAGCFLSQNFGSNLDLRWPGKYPKHYYWWSPSLRGHVFLSSAISIQMKDPGWLDRLSVYLEANTNDLYLASYFNKNNESSLSFYDIVFFGAGLKCYLRKR